MAWSNKARLASIRARRIKMLGGGKKTAKAARTGARMLRRNGLAVKGTRVVPLRPSAKKLARQSARRAAARKPAVIRVRASNKAGYRKWRPPTGAGGRYSAAYRKQRGW